MAINKGIMRGKSFRGIFPGILLVALFLLLAGCGARGPRDEAVVIEFLRWSDPPATERCLAELIKTFEEEHPGIRIKTETVHVNAYQQKALTLQAGGLFPDVFFTPRGPRSALLSAFRERDLFLDLKPIVEQDQDFNFKDFHHCGTEPFLIDGKLYAIAVDLNPVVLYYNKDLFDKEGLPYPNKTWSKEKFREAAKRLTKDTNNDGRIDQRGFLISSYTAWFMLERGNVPLFNEDKTRVTINNEKAENLLQYLVDLRLKDNVSPLSGEVEMGVYELFATGRLAMMESIFAFSERFFQQKSLNWDIAFPLVLGDNYYTSLPITGYSISKTTKHPEEAWKFVRFMTSPYAQKKMRERLNTIPPRISLLKDPQVFAPPPGNISIIHELLEKTSFSLSFERYTEFEVMASSKIEEALLGIKGVKQVLREIEKEGNGILKR